MRRIFAFLTTVGIGVGLATGLAHAHEEITPKTAVVGKPAFLQLSAANEKQVALTSITLHAPAGLPFGSTTRSPAGWRADVHEDSITWSGGSVAPDTFDTWGFEIEGADQAKTYTYKADLGYADGSKDSVDVPLTATAGESSSSGSTAAKTASTSDSSARGLARIAIVLAVLAFGAAMFRRSRTGGDAPASRADSSNDW